MPHRCELNAHRCDLRRLCQLVLPWPVEPFGPVAEVSEASGTEEQMVEALRGAQVCLTQMGAVTERALAASPELRLVCVGRGGRRVPKHTLPS
jgi:D-3-phosphoglycerate dehydrogenase